MRTLKSPWLKISDMSLSSPSTTLFRLVARFEMFSFCIYVLCRGHAMRPHEDMRKGNFLSTSLFNETSKVYGFTNLEQTLYNESYKFANIL